MFHGLPPASLYSYTMTDSGRHGWVTLLLPYFEQQALRGQYDFSAAWYDPPNRTVVLYQLPIMECPSVAAPRIISVAPIGVTFQAAAADYFAIQGLNSNLAPSYLPASYNFDGVMVDDRVRRFAEITDGTSHTMMVSEMAARPVFWHNHQADAAFPPLTYGYGRLGLEQQALAADLHRRRPRFARPVRVALQQPLGDLQFPPDRCERALRRRFGAVFIGIHRPRRVLCRRNLIGRRSMEQWPLMRIER